LNRFYPVFWGKMSKKCRYTEGYKIRHFNYKYQYDGLESQLFTTL
jgi:hypothetical protein